jgi:GNAT superfamily N-acetyltransferase
MENIIYSKGVIKVTSVSPELRESLKRLIVSSKTERNLSSQNLDKIIDDPELFYGIGFFNELPCGYWQAEQEGYSDLDSRYTYVDQEFRRKGVGRALKLHQIQSAQSIGVNLLRGRIDVNNLPSIKMHESLGIMGEIHGGWWRYRINLGSFKHLN